MPAKKTPPTNTLEKDLIATLGKAKAMNNDVKTEALINFIKTALVKCGHKPSRVFVPGYQQEALIAAALGKKVNPKAKGYDLVDENGIKTEIKSSNSPLGKKANVNFTAPKPLKGETEAAYYRRMAMVNTTKGNVMFVHFYGENGNVNAANTYVLTHEFLTMLMQHKKAFTTQKINLGGVGCWTCSRVHRMDAYIALEKEWVANKAAFDEKKLDIPVAGKCSKASEEGEDEEEEEDDDTVASSSDEDTVHVEEDGEQDEEEEEEDEEEEEEKEEEKKEEGKKAVSIHQLMNLVATEWTKQEPVYIKRPVETQFMHSIIAYAPPTPLQKAQECPLFKRMEPLLEHVTWRDIQHLGISHFLELLDPQNGRDTALGMIFWQRNEDLIRNRISREDEDDDEDDDVPPLVSNFEDSK